MGKSTGPRTLKGKARSSLNAVKHWIQSGRILLEEQKDAAVLRNGFIEDFQPRGLIEHEVIDDLTLNRLIKRRIDIALTREYYKASVEKNIDTLEKHERSGAQYWQRSGLERWRTRGEPGERACPEDCVRALEDLKAGISDRGPRLDDLESLRRIYGDEPTEHGAYLIRIFLPLAKDGTVLEKSEPAVQDKLKKVILKSIAIEIERQKDRARLASSVEEIAYAWEIQEPPAPALEIILRYRTTNTREFKDLLDFLERIRGLKEPAA